MNTFTNKLRQAGINNDSMLCVGLDPDSSRLPQGWAGKTDHFFDFCAAIVDATADLAIAFKPQIAYFAAVGAEVQLERLIAYIRRVAPQVPIILDAKRGDIGATAAQYAREAYERYDADAVTLSPYMGFDSVEPYLAYRDKGTFLLCRTSNAGGDDLQNLQLAATDALPAEKLYERVARLANSVWNGNGQMGLVVGATYPQEIARVRAMAPDMPLLIPGVGAQGGDAQATVQAAWAGHGSTVINSSRAILYASDGSDFAAAARAVAQETRLLLNLAKPA